MFQAVRFLVRGSAVVLAAMSAYILYLFQVLQGKTRTPENREIVRGEVLAELFVSLGATFIKFGQILSTRPDLLGPGYIKALSRLQDQVPSLPFEELESVLDKELSRDARGQLAFIEPNPLAAASVAQVHRGVLISGEEVALKIQRPGAAKQIWQDVLLMTVIAGWLDKIPTMKMLSLPGAVERFGEAMKGQLDFRDEAANNRRFSDLFATTPDIGVPKLYPEMCTERVLVMEMIHGVRASEPEQVGGQRAKLARIGFDAVLKMVFNYGFVHADMHPGNILLTPEGRVILIDLGLVAEIPDEMKRPWVETFVALSSADAKAAARLFYEYAPTVGQVDYPAYEVDVRDHFKCFAGKNLGEVEAAEVLGGMMNVLRKHRVQIDPVFTVVNIALLVSEGLGKQLDESLDFMTMAGPYLMEAVATAPPGRSPRRTPPLEEAVA